MTYSHCLTFFFKNYCSLCSPFSNKEHSLIKKDKAFCIGDMSVKGIGYLQVLFLLLNLEAWHAYVKLKFFNICSWEIFDFRPRNRPTAENPARIKPTGP